MSDQSQHGASLEAIQHHYDVSNDFYKYFLDKNMSYSSAFWESDQESLEQAQDNKIDYHISNLELSEKDNSILDVGCGWGAVMMKLIEDIRIDKVTGITLSQSQVDHVIEKQVTNIEARLENWQDHKAADGSYDGIISIGAFEHFSKPEDSPELKIQSYRDFFKKCHKWLKPSGVISLQTIAAGNMRREDLHQFFADEIFPESDLPRLSDISIAAERLFEIVTVRNDRAMYARTLRAWLSNLQGNKEIVVSKFGQELYDRYAKYFSLLIVSFDVFKSQDLYRIKLRKIDKPRE